MEHLITTPASAFGKSARRPAARHVAVGLALAIAVAATTGARGDETWPVDNLKAITGHKLSVVGSPRVEATDVGRALVFDGAHDGIFVPAIPIAGDKAFTIEVLFSPAEGGNEAQRFFHVQDTDGKRALMEIRTNGKGGWWLDAFMMTSPGTPKSGLTLIDPERIHPTNRWYWVAMRYDGEHLADFVNGVKELEGQHRFEPIGEGKISIGVRQNLVYWFKGAIREVRFHHQALPEEKLQRVTE